MPRWYFSKCNSTCWHLKLWQNSLSAALTVDPRGSLRLTSVELQWRWILESKCFFIALKYWLLDAQSFLKLLCTVLRPAMVNVLSTGANCHTLGVWKRNLYYTRSYFFLFIYFFTFFTTHLEQNFYFNLQLYWTVKQIQRLNKERIGLRCCLRSPVDNKLLPPRIRVNESESTMQTSLVCAESITATTRWLEENSVVQRHEIEGWKMTPKWCDVMLHRTWKLAVTDFSVESLSSRNLTVNTFTNNQMRKYF